MKKIFLLLLLFSMTQQACKKNQGTTNSPIDNESIEKTISPAGGNLTLLNIASVQFPQGSFSKNVVVKLYRTKSTEMRKEMEIASILYDIKEELNYEIRINTKQLPDSIIKITLNVPDSFISKIPKDYGLRAYGNHVIDDSIETAEGFRPLDTKFYGSKKQLEVQLHPMYFSTRLTTDQSFEAIITIGISLGEKPSAGRIAGVLDCCDEIKTICPLNDCFITSYYGWRVINGKDDFHNGVDLRAVVGTDVFAAASGKVLKAESSPLNGNFLVLEHKSANCVIRTKYLHLSELSVKAEESVTTGQKIGKSGQSIDANGKPQPHLHFEYHKKGNKDNESQDIDPKLCIPKFQKVIVIMSACFSGCLGSVGVGEKFGYKLYNIDDVNRTKPVVETTITVTENFTNYPPCSILTSTPYLELYLPAGTYIGELNYYNLLITNFFGASFQVIPTQTECRFVIIV